MRSVVWSTVLLGAVLLALAVAPASGSVTSAHPAQRSTAPSGPESLLPSGGGNPGSFARLTPSSSPTSLAFDRRVDETTTALARAGVPAQQVRLPYVGASAQMVGGAIVPGYAVTAANVSPDYPRAPAPVGLAYYGESDPSGKVLATTVNASSVAGTVTVDQMDALYLDTDVPDMWGIQLNAVLGDVTVAGAAGYEFWVQNAVDVFQHNDTIDLGEDTWNFSSPSASIPTGTATILSHDPNGSVTAGLYIGEGPWIHTPLPFTLTLYLNSSVTAAGDQELWYNYSVVAAGGLHEHGNYDWVVFNSGGSPSTPIAPFVADGSHLDPVGLPNDYELDFGIGGFNGADMDVLSANASATLDYCPIAVGVCAPGAYLSVPAAENFGGETGETSTGLCETFVGTTASASAGPFILRGLWGFAGATGASAGSTAVTNGITVSGQPDSGAVSPYVFVFLHTPSLFDDQFEWAPDVPGWSLAPGTYDYEVLLGDYAEQTGTLVVGSSPVSLAVDLAYDTAAGVYTPLWAFSNAQLAGISFSGTGTVGDQYLLFNTPTASCTDCGGAGPNELAPVFFSANDFLYPTFPGVLLDGTTAYVDLDAPVNFTVDSMSWGLVVSGAMPSVDFDLQIGLVSTEHVTLSNASTIGGWPAMFEVETLAGLVNATENPFPQASVMIWNSTSDLVRGNVFVPTPVVPQPGEACLGVCPAITCDGCVSPDALLLYGGSANTVWGNTFREATGDPAVTDSLYAGLAEAESGDLLYNNNFSVDNPTVYLPFDVYTDACPDGYAGDCGPLVPPVYADTWNVSAQPASAISATVNGFPLSGNILGASCPTQGGNFWNDYGNALNPSGQLPFVDRYNYSEILGILPAGSTAVQASVRAGGDFLPLTATACRAGGLQPVRFHESGLAPGASWSVWVDGAYQLTSAGHWINTSVSAGLLTYAFEGPVGTEPARVTGPGSPTYSATNVTGPLTLKVRFSLTETVEFEVSTTPHWPGLAANVSWGVTVTSLGKGGPPPASNSTEGSAIAFRLPQGDSFRFAVSKPSTYLASGGHGSFTVPSHTLVKRVKFRLDLAAVTFVEHGLLRGQSWSVTVTELTPTPGSQGRSSASTHLEFLLLNGSYSYSVPTLDGETPSPASGDFNVSAPHGATFTISFHDP